MQRSRRDFLRVALISSGAALLAACGQSAPTPPPTPAGAAPTQAAPPTASTSSRTIPASASATRRRRRSSQAFYSARWRARSAAAVPATADEPACHAPLGHRSQYGVQRQARADGPGFDVTQRFLFENVLACRNRHGLLAEHIDPRTREQWGNFVQTYSMVGIIASAIRLSVRWDQAF